MFKYFLASKSPRRKDLMTQIGIEFQVMISERDEMVVNHDLLAYNAGWYPACRTTSQKAFTKSVRSCFVRLF